MKLITCGNFVAGTKWKASSNGIDGYSRFYYMKGGDVTCTYEGKSFKLEHNKFYIFPTNKIYHLVQNPDDPIRCTYFHFDVFPSIITSTHCLDIDKLPSLNHLVKSMSYEISPSNQVSEAFIHMIKPLEIILHRTGCFESIAEPYLSVLEYINNHYMNYDLSVVQLSEIANLSVDYFIKNFKKTIGLTPYQFILKHRMFTACNYLMAGHSVNHVSHLVGYDNPKVFSSAFHKYFNIYPSNFSLML